MRVYVYFRNYEEKRNFNQQEFENVVREAGNFITAKKNQDALAYVNEYFKEFKEVYYFSSLQQNERDVQQNVQSAMMHEIIF